MPSRLVASILCAAAAAPIACGEDDTRQLRVYSSLPHHGVAAEHGLAVERGMRLALRRTGGRVGKFAIEYVPLDDSLAAAQTWTPERVARNARRAAQDDSAIAMVGDFDASASEISMPILNVAPLAQVTPAGTASGLTADEPGAGPIEPETHYPTGGRHFVRLAPRDTIQARALVRLMKDEGCGAVYLTHDGGSYADSLRPAVRIAAGAAGLRLVGGEQASLQRTAAAVSAAGAPCFLYLGLGGPDAARLYEAVAATAPGVKLFGANALVSPPSAIAVGRQAERRLLLTAPVVGPDAYPPAGRRFLAAFRSAYDVRNPDPYAIYGYEAMSLVLDAVRRAGDEGDDPKEVIARLFATRRRASVLGVYSVTGNGDTTLTNYGVWASDGGRAVFRRAVRGD